MSQSYSHNLVHCVFGTKDRRDSIRNPEELWRYLVAVAYAKKIHVVAAGGTLNHVHLLVLLPQTIALAAAMQEVKANSSRWMREASRLFQWQRGYGAFSVSESQRETVAHYIANQAEHHRRWSFEDEYVSLLKRSGVEFDPRYVLG
jgi:REP element-mobilizing transposase RayT